jgi:hypothetical protein
MALSLLCSPLLLSAALLDVAALLLRLGLLLLQDTALLAFLGPQLVLSLVPVSAGAETLLLLVIVLIRVLMLLYARHACTKFWHANTASAVVMLFADKSSCSSAVNWVREVGTAPESGHPAKTNSFKPTGRCWGCSSCRGFSDRCKEVRLDRAVMPAVKAPGSAAGQDRESGLTTT